MARKMAAGLRQKGLAVWLADEQVVPGDDWGLRVSQALNACDAMVALFTPNTPASGSVQWDVGFALTNKSYRHRVIPVLVGGEEDLPAEVVPWILMKFRVVRLADRDQADQAVQEVAQALAAAAEPVPVSLERTFGEHARRWRDETGGYSLTHRRYTHPSYRAILTLGKPAVPLILRELERQPDYWFEALEALTGCDVAPDARTFDEAVASWVEWGKHEGHLS